MSIKISHTQQNLLNLTFASHPFLSLKLTALPLIDSQALRSEGIVIYSDVLQIQDLEYLTVILSVEVGLEHIENS